MAGTEQAGKGTVEAASRDPQRRRRASRCSGKGSSASYGIERPQRQRPWQLPVAGWFTERQAVR